MIIWFWRLCYDRSKHYFLIIHLKLGLYYFMAKKKNVQTTHRLTKENKFWRLYQLFYCLLYTVHLNGALLTFHQCLTTYPQTSTPPLRSQALLPLTTPHQQLQPADGHYTQPRISPLAQPTLHAPPPPVKPIWTRHFDPEQDKTEHIELWRKMLSLASQGLRIEPLINAVN